MTGEIEREPRHEATVERVYRNDQIEVTWEPGLCIHVGACFRGSPQAFDPRRRPWVDVGADRPERIVEVVAQCPTGALHARWIDRRTQDEPETPVEVHAQQDGPLYVRGAVRVVDQSGKVVREDTRIALCRCGASGNKPFCDDSHFRIGFTS